MKIEDIPVVSADRSCNGCTACCDGWLAGEAHGYSFYPGKRCHFISESSCTIYEKRPENPCISFVCMWITDKRMPEWMKPSKSNVILVQRKTENFAYVAMHEMGSKVDASVLSWVIQGCLNNNVPLLYQVNGGWNSLGPSDFVQEWARESKNGKVFG